MWRVPSLFNYPGLCFTCSYLYCICICTEYVWCICNNIIKYCTLSQQLPEYMVFRPDICKQSPDIYCTVAPVVKVSVFFTKIPIYNLTFLVQAYFTSRVFLINRYTVGPPLLARFCSVIVYFLVEGRGEYRFWMRYIGKK